MELLEQLVVRERHRVGGRQTRQQAALVALVVEQHDLAVAGAVGELSTLGGVADGDGQGELAGDGCGTIQRDPALHESSHHGEEAAAGARDRGAVHAVLVDVAVAVEQVGARNANAREVQTPVVDAVEAALEAVVFAADTGEEVPAVTDRHIERMHTVVHTRDDQLREHHRRLAVLRGIAQVVLPGVAKRRVDDELVGGRVVGGGGADGGDIRTVSALGHREGAGRRQAHDRGQELLVRALGAEVHDRGTEEPPLHAGLDLHRGVADDEFFEGGDVGAVVLFAAERDREGAMDDALLDQARELPGDTEAVLRNAEPGDLMELIPLQQFARVFAGVRPAGEEHLGERGRVDVQIAGGARRRGCAGRGGTFDGVGHDGLLEACARHATPRRAPRPISLRKTTITRRLERETFGESLQTLETGCVGFLR